MDFYAALLISFILFGVSPLTKMNPNYDQDPLLLIESTTEGVAEAESDYLRYGPSLLDYKNNTLSTGQPCSTSSGTKEEPCCRTRDGRLLPSTVFALDTCAQCYAFELSKKKRLLPPWIPLKQIFLYKNHTIPILVLVNTTDFNHTELADANSESLFSSITDTRWKEDWIHCCTAAIRCCQTMTSSPSESTKTFCPRTWDGWQCWGDTEPGTTVFEPCPSYSYIESRPTCSKSATKQCMPDGSWFRKKGLEKTDYSSCGHLNSIRLRLQCHVCALGVSIVALVPALIIFSTYRALKVDRIALHKQLFLSLLLESCCSLSFRLLQLYANNLMNKSPAWCVVLCLVRKYARQTNYMWYLCEGFYLHKLLASAFAEQKSLLLFYIIGWTFPILPLGLYAILRGTLYENSYCWNLPLEGLEWIIQLPPLLAILMNLFFIVNIIRILLSKVRATHAFEPSQFRMAVRATLMVVPLFGLQYIITIYRPKGGTCSWLDLYLIINNVIDGGTGLVVSIIFCYSNTEVRALLRRSWCHMRDQYAPILPKSSRWSQRHRSFSTVQTTLVDMNNSQKKTSLRKPNYTLVLNRSATSPQLSTASSQYRLTDVDVIEEEIPLTSEDFKPKPMKKAPSCSHLL